MPQETGYQQQTAPRAATAMPLANANTFGAQVGASIADLGATLHERDVRAYQLERKVTADSEASDFQRRFAEARDRLDTVARNARNNAGPGGAGHEAAMRKALDDERKALFGGITEDNVRREAEGQFESWSRGFGQREADFENGQRLGKVATDWASATDIAANRIRGQHDPQAYADEIQLGYRGIDALANVPQDVKEKLKRELVDQKYAIAFLSGLNDNNPALAREMIDKGLFDASLEPQQLTALRNGAEVEVRRAEGEARAQATLLRGQVNGEIDLAVRQLGDGVPMEDGALEALQGRAAAAGLGKDVYDLGKWRVVNNYNRITQSWLPTDFAGEINKLNTRIANAGTNAKPADIIARDHLVKLRTARVGQLTNDPFDYATRNGMAIAPVDFAQPASVAQRKTQAEGLAKQLGTKPLYLMPDEARALSQRYGQGIAGKLEVARSLAQLGGRAAMDAARQVAPSDPVFHRAVTLPLPYAKLALNGSEARRANPAITKVPVEDKDDFDKRDRAIGGAMRALPQGELGAVQETARNIAASLIAENGGDYTPELYATAINMALGATGTGSQRKGGLGLWGNRSFLLPDGVTQAGFEAAISRRQSAPGSAPVNLDGTALDLKRATPVLIGPGVYRWEGPDGGIVRTRDGQTFTTTVRAR